MKERLISILEQRGYKVYQIVSTGTNFLIISKNGKEWHLRSYLTENEDAFRSYLTESRDVFRSHFLKYDNYVNILNDVEFINTCYAVFRKERIMKILKNIECINNI